MGKASRLFGDKADFNIFIRNAARVYIDDAIKKTPKNIPYKNSVRNFLTNYKDPLKYAAMCYFYSQGVKGRFNGLISTASDLNLSWNAEGQKQLFHFSANFDKIIGESFPGLPDQLRLLRYINKCILDLSKNGMTCLATVNGSVIKYRHSSYTQISRNRFDVTTGKSIAFSYNIKKDRANLQKSNDSFLANIMHSLDSAFIHEVTLNLFDKHGFILSHLHDSLQMHPNHLEVTYKEIYDIYQGPLFRDLSSRVLKTPWIRSFTPDHFENPEENLQKILNLFVVFEASNDPGFFSKIKNLKPEEMYPLED